MTLVPGRPRRQRRLLAAFRSGPLVEVHAVHIERRAIPNATGCAQEGWTAVRSEPASPGWAAPN